MNIQNNTTFLPALIARVQDACKHAGRPADSVRVLAVSKTQPAEAVRHLHRQGQLAFGESYVDEAVAKIRELSDLALEWHYIGPIQSNKTRDIAEHFDWVQSVDRLKIIRRLEDQRTPDLEPLQVLIQVNIDQEPQKAGCMSQDVAMLAREISGCRHLTLRGLMAIPAAREDFSEQKQSFQRLHDIFEALKRDYPSMDTLSAGMSADLEAAIAAGSTMVRVGTALFGERLAVSGKR